MRTCKHFCRITIAIGYVLALTTGCQSDNTYIAQTDQINNLKQEKAELKGLIEQLQKENDQLHNHVQVLSDLPADVKGRNVYQLRNIKITNYTNLYDKDNNGAREKLIVYIQPIDQDGDIIKAAGAVDVQLWNLKNQTDKALLGQWRVEQDELKKLWFATLITINYRLTFDVAGIVESFDEPLTVKVTFTDYLSGKVFEAQKVIKPD
jgi:hypothetical protein